MRAAIQTNQEVLMMIFVTITPAFILRSSVSSKNGLPIFTLSLELGYSSSFFVPSHSSKSLVRKHDCLNIALFFFSTRNPSSLRPVGLIAEVHSTKGENQMLQTNIRAGFSLWLTTRHSRHSSYTKLKMFQSVVRQFMP